MRHSLEIGWFVKRAQPGRPQVKGLAVPGEVRQWMSRYFKELSLLGDNLLGWKFQEMFRGTLFTRLSVGARMVELTAFCRCIGHDGPIYSRERDFNYVAQVWTSFGGIPL